ncbi:hypothetical protein PHYBOEH_006636 [Phytophthora boehmeriae]|uniref:Serine protease family S33 n=1 Tax=Phytophthora boehmeriae TaxID=109152 RepID=A0A8T1WI98_9STRA|nr:hypothetical protein PHYBOEH_006636 [Phytophthora boehmeriae]
MAALDATRKLTADGELNPAINFQGMALLAPVGCSSHHVMRPRANAVVIKMLKSQNRVIVGLASRIVKAIYTKLLRFPADSPPDPFVAAVVRAGTTDFELMREQVALLRTLGMPTLVAWSQSDEYIQEEIPRELERLCYTGPRLSFASGGHNIQKTRADQIAPVLNSWVANVLSGTAVKSSADIQQLP